MRLPFLAFPLVVLSPLVVLAMAGMLSGCATPPPASDKEGLADFQRTNDPLEPTNRVFYAINNAIDEVVLHPLAVGYINAVPTPVRNTVHNALANLNTPVVLANDMMQGKPRRAGDTVSRFIINSTVGVGGLFDIAKIWGIPGHDADFGETLAIWGVPEGPFLYLPILGPTDPRDVGGLGVDVALSPFTWVGQGHTVANLEYAQYGMTALDLRASLVPDLEKVKEQALDPYATFRSLYRQHRHAQIEAIRKDGRQTVPSWYSAAPTAK